MMLMLTCELVTNLGSGFRDWLAGSAAAEMEDPNRNEWMEMGRRMNGQSKQGKPKHFRLWIGNWNWYWAGGMGDDAFWLIPSFFIM